LELGRELLHRWGYKRVDELIWVKTNSLKCFTIGSGRTGHWLNHSKEHCLVGYKGRPAINRWVMTHLSLNVTHLSLPVTLSHSLSLTFCHSLSLWRMIPVKKV
jgi:N6-adenosine-specific RNA methylase IME4